MNPDDLIRILDELGKRLGPAGAHVFELAVRQAAITGALGVTLGLICVAIVAGASIATLRIWRAGWKRWYALPESERKYPSLSGQPDEFTFMPLMFVYIIFVPLAMLAFAVGVPALLNPEYAALRDILSAIGGAK